ncbi:retrotransposon protein, putative, ty1-copia subclass, partial [Tanacetum coccineum]
PMRKDKPFSVSSTHQLLLIPIRVVASFSRAALVTLTCLKNRESKLWFFCSASSRSMIALIGLTYFNLGTITQYICNLWDYALETAARILNMVPTKKAEKTPYEVWHGQAHKLSYLKVWGCEALVKRDTLTKPDKLEPRQAPKLSYLKVWGCEALVKRDTLTKPDKLEPRSIKCIFIGYPKETMCYSFYYPPENKVLVARNAEFLENGLITQEASGSL